MRVMCINSEWNDSEQDNPVIGEYYTVVDQEKGRNGKLFYSIAGYYHLYIHSSFSPLSEIDETELAEQRQTELV